MSNPSPPKGRILIGEDIGTIALGMQQALIRAGFSVETASDGEEVLRLAREAQPDLLVLDIMMPKLHGIEVLRQLRADSRTSRVGVVVSTAKDFRTEQHECEELGIVDYLVKPFSNEKLIESVEAFFTKRSRAADALGMSDTSGKTHFQQTLEGALGCFSLWGTRGSTPVPGARFLRHGGNTSCMSVTFGEEKFIFDAGSGIRELGLEVMNGRHRKLHMFITHTHWDHIQGFPFFMPAYVPGFELTIYGAEGFGKDLEHVFRGQLDFEYFPVQMDDMNSQIVFRRLNQDPVVVGGAKVTWEFAQHPGATVGYKIDVAGRKIAWVPDNEFLQGYTGVPDDLTRDNPLVAPYSKMIDFLSDADIVVHEAQYTTEEYPNKIRWGHSSISNAAVLMKLAGVKRWIITHHDPMHDDAFLETKLNLTRRILDRIGHSCLVTHGYDGLTEYF